MFNRIQDPHFRKIAVLSKNLWQIRWGGGFGPKSELHQYVGCTSEFLRAWLNYTERQNCEVDGPTHIDHLQPLSLIRRNSEEDFKHFFSWKNTRVVPAQINLEKHKRDPTSLEIEDQQCMIADFLNLICF